MKTTSTLRRRRIDALPTVAIAMTVSHICLLSEAVEVMVLDIQDPIYSLTAQVIRSQYDGLGLGACINQVVGSADTSPTAEAQPCCTDCKQGKVSDPGQFVVKRLIYVAKTATYYGVAGMGEGAITGLSQGEALSHELTHTGVIQGQHAVAETFAAGNYGKSVSACYLPENEEAAVNSAIAVGKRFLSEISIDARDSAISKRLDNANGGEIPNVANGEWRVNANFALRQEVSQESAEIEIDVDWSKIEDKHEPECSE